MVTNSVTEIYIKNETHSKYYETNKGQAQVPVPSLRKVPDNRRKLA